MFEIIKNYGDEFDGWWMDLFNVIFRIFDFIKHEELGSDVSAIQLVSTKLYMNIWNVFYSLSVLLHLDIGFVFGS